MTFKAPSTRIVARKEIPIARGSKCRIPLLLWSALIAARASGAQIEDLTAYPGLPGGYSYYIDGGTTSRSSSGSDEYTGKMDGQPVLGYFINPWCRELTSGVAHPLSDLAGGYRAAWLIDQFAVGLGRSGIPSGWGGGPLDDATKRHALGFAVFEVGMSPLSDPPDLDNGQFSVWSWAPEQSTAVALGRAYLSALAGATLNTTDLESRFDLVVGDQWVNLDYSRWVVTVPEPAAALSALAGFAMLALRRRRMKSAAFLIPA